MAIFLNPCIIRVGKFVLADHAIVQSGGDTKSHRHTAMKIMDEIGRAARGEIRDYSGALVSPLRDIDATDGGRQQWCSKLDLILIELIERPSFQFDLTQVFDNIDVVQQRQTHLFETGDLLNRGSTGIFQRRMAMLSMFVTNKFDGGPWVEFKRAMERTGDDSLVKEVDAFASSLVDAGLIEPGCGETGDSVELVKGCFD